MPPLTSTIARGFIVGGTSSDPLKRRVPNEFVQLQSEPGRNSIADHPFGQFLRVEQAMRTVATAARIFPECGRKQNRIYPLSELMPDRKIKRKLVIATAAQDELDLVPGGEHFQVFRPESIPFAGIRAFYVHNLDHGRRHAIERSLSAGLKQDGIAVVEQSLHHRDDLPLLQHG